MLGLARTNERETNSHLSTIHSSGTHLLELINNILDLSKIESGHMEVEWMDCAPHAVVQEVVKVLRVKAQERGILLDCEARTPIPETIQSDPARLRQIVTNLVGNAIKFTERGCVTVVLHMVTPGKESQLVIDVVEPAGQPAEAAEELAAEVSQNQPAIVSQLSTGNPRFHAIVKRFVARLDEQLHNMEIASEARDYETLAGLVHWLKGSGGTVGFDDFTNPPRNARAVGQR